MARRKKKKEGVLRRIFSNVKEETLESVWGVVFAVLALFLLFAAWGKAGLLGESAYRALSTLLGVGYFLLPILFLTLAGLFWSAIHRTLNLSRVVGSLTAFFAALGLVEMFADTRGGLLGNALTVPLVAVVDRYAAFLILGGLFTIALLILFDSRLSLSWIASVFRFGKGRSELNRKKELFEDIPEEDGDQVEDKAGAEEIGKEEAEDEGIEDDDEDGDETGNAEQKNKKGGLGGLFSFGKNKRGARSPFGDTLREDDYSPPPLSLLERDRGKPGVGDIKANANIIKRTLENFGIEVQIDEVAIGPSVSRYALKPAEGVKLSRIIGLQNNLELALAAHPVRIEAPIPGRSQVGIEVPNSAKATVGLGTLLSGEEFQKAGDPLTIALGKDISGNVHFANISKMPHLLIAGSTGSGKSVMIHTLITSLLYRNSPTALRLLMIDPKRVELTLYNNIPHLLTPVITDAKKAILVLKWAAREMERRYDILETEAVRDIGSYHKTILAPALAKARAKEAAEGEEGDRADLPEGMPHIVIVIDELADIMQAYPRELEAAVVRLAQMSRAVGIHLVLSTQRPSVNVITGLIKANIPARMALQVASQIDSRTILDGSGAEKLLGAGDMLYLSGDMSKPRRMQTAFISEQEVKKVVGYLRTQHSPNDNNETINFSAESGQDGKNALFDDSLDNDFDDDDELYEDAREEVMRAGKASTSYLQRKLRIGYSRAARLMDILEEREVIGPADGSKPREVLDRYGDENKSEGDTEDR